MEQWAWLILSKKSWANRVEKACCNCLKWENCELVWCATSKQIVSQPIWTSLIWIAAMISLSTVAFMINSHCCDCLIDACVSLLNDDRMSVDAMLLLKLFGNYSVSIIILHVQFQYKLTAISKSWTELYPNLPRKNFETIEIRIRVDCRSAGENRHV